MVFGRTSSHCGLGWRESAFLRAKNNHSIPPEDQGQAVKNAMTNLETLNDQWSRHLDTCDNDSLVLELLQTYKEILEARIAACLAQRNQHEDAGRKANELTENRPLTPDSEVWGRTSYCSWMETWESTVMLQLLLHRQMASIAVQLAPFALESPRNLVITDMQATVNRMIIEPLIAAGTGRSAPNPANTWYAEMLVPFYNASFGLLAGSTMANDSTMVYCQVTGYPYDAQIVPALQIAELDCNYLLGKPLSTYQPTDLENHLLVNALFARGLEESILAIVPVVPSSETSTTTWRLAVVDEDQRNIIAGKLVHLDNAATWGRWDGQWLQFRNICRPSAERLYARFVYTVIKLRIKQDRAPPPPGWYKYIKSLWPSPRPWVNTSLIMKIALAIGDTYVLPSLLRNETFQFVQPTLSWEEEHDLAKDLAYTLKQDVY